jgi:NYN domain
LLDPLLYAQRLLQARNANLKPGFAAASLRKVLVYRGLPSSEHDPKAYDRSQAARAQWERDRRVQVTLRPLKYSYTRDATGRPVHDVHGSKMIERVQEKGVDVLCALALIREARDQATDLLVLASSDSDLAPAVDEARALGSAKIETCCWWEPQNRGHQIKPDVAVWNTRLGEQTFRLSHDPTKYL